MALIAIGRHIVEWSRFSSRPRILGHYRGLATSPPVGYTLKWAEAVA
jgi:hypothetical protein